MYIFCGKTIYNLTIITLDFVIANHMKPSLDSAYKKTTQIENQHLPLPQREC